MPQARVGEDPHPRSERFLIRTGIDAPSVHGYDDHARTPLLVGNPDDSGGPARKCLLHIVELAAADLRRQ